MLDSWTQRVQARILLYVYMYMQMYIVLAKSVSKLRISRSADLGLRVVV